LHLVNPRLPFEIWSIDISSPFTRREKRYRDKYIIKVVKYLNKWEEEKPIKNCTKETTKKFIYENIATIFGYPLTIICDKGNHFINSTIEVLLSKFMIDHIRTISYHPQDNGAIKSFNKTLHKGLTKICGHDRDNWDDKFPTILWAYRIAYKILTG
jgi:transposase InsO family protein